jgi:molybdopterin molybdotransferase
MLADVGPLGVERMMLSETLGRVLAADVVASVSLPPWDNASMDGFAVHADDVRGATAEHPAVLRVIETIAAGQRPTRPVAMGEAARIMTGAAVPAGADSVVRVEDSGPSSDAGMVTIVDDRDVLRNVRRRGEDVIEGARVLSAGTLIGPAHVGVLASLGEVQPSVCRRPRVAILATGDELVELDGFRAVRAGERIVSSNSYSIAAAVRAAGGEPVSLGVVPDDPRAIAERLQTARGCDMILTSGGVSVGDYDHVRRVIVSLGGEISLWRVRMRPGAPLAFGRLFGVPWFGLPGNPVSALVTFELFARPLLRVLGGHRRPHRRTIRVVLDEEVRLAAPLTHYLRATLADGADGTLHARLTGAQSSGMLTSMSNADALLILPPEPMIATAGSIVRAIPLDGDLGGTDRFPGSS